MNNKIIKLNETELNQLVEDCVKEVLNEGFFDRIKQGYQGAKQGYKSQKMLDRGTDNFKQNLSREDMMNMSNPMSARPENTATEQAREAYRQYKTYQEKANEMLNLYNQLRKKYNLDKTGVGQVQSKEKPEAGFARPHRMGQRTPSPTRGFRQKHSTMTGMPTPGTNGIR